jgi:hypothetical protein
MTELEGTLWAAQAKQQWERENPVEFEIEF